MFNGMLERWKDGKMERWKGGKMEYRALIIFFPLFHLKKCVFVNNLFFNAL